MNATELRERYEAARDELAIAAVVWQECEGRAPETRRLRILRERVNEYIAAQKAYHRAVGISSGAEPERTGV